jgi:transposase
VTQIICGVDVSAAWLEASVRPAGAFARFANTADGVLALLGFCREHAVGLVVMEATGGYERLAIGVLSAEGMGTALINPRAVRRFAEAMGLLEKTDRIDAAVIAWGACPRAALWADPGAEAKGIVAQKPADEAQRRLAALVTRLRQLTELRTMQTNQRRLVDDPDTKASIEQLLALLARQTRELEGKIALRIGQDPLWTALDAAFRSIKGVADRTVARLLAELPEIGTLSNKAVAKLAGLAPIARDSGKRAGKRAVRGGRSGIRSILFVVADVARRHEPDFTAFHRKLSDAGKAKKAIRIALARKLLVRLNAKARDVRRQLAAA